MNRSSRTRIATALGVLGLTGCDATSPPETAVSQPGPQGIEFRRPVGLEPRAPDNPAVAAASEAILGAVGEEDPFARARRLGALLPTLGPEGIPGVEQVIRDPTRDLAASDLELMLRFWAQHEPEQATRWAVEMAPSGYQALAVHATLPRWVEVDPQAVLPVVRKWENERKSIRGAVQVALVRGWYARNPAEVARHMRRHEMGLARLRRLKTFVRLTAQREGPEAAVRWAESVPADDLVYKRDVYRQLAAVLPYFDLETAVRWCDARCHEPYARDVRRIIASRWVRFGGGADALTWLAASRASAERDANVAQVFAIWYDVSPAESLAWFETRVAAEDSESWLPLLYPSYAVILMRDRPAEAIEWAGRIEDGTVRELTMIRIAQAWRQRDEAAAEAWLSASPLSEQARNRARGNAQLPNPPAS